MNVICNTSTINDKKHVNDILYETAKKDGGIAIGSGNSIPDYVNFKRYLEMVRMVRRFRGDKEKTNIRGVKLW